MLRSPLPSTVISLLCHIPLCFLNFLSFRPPTHKSHICLQAALTFSCTVHCTTTRAAGESFYALMCFPMVLLSSRTSRSIHTWCMNSVWPDVFFPPTAVHKHTSSLQFLADLLFHRSQRTWGWPLQHIKFYISQLFFNRHCWVGGISSTHLFLSGCRLLCEFALDIHGGTCCHQRSGGCRTVPICFACVPLVLIPHSMWKVQ